MIDYIVLYNNYDEHFLVVQKKFLVPIMLLMGICRIQGDRYGISDGILEQG